MPGFGPRVTRTIVTASTWKIRNIKKMYRLDITTYEEWYIQGCAICRQDFIKTPDVDHNHGCDHFGKGTYSCRACVRGLLCRSCNLRVKFYECGQNYDDDIRRYLLGVKDIEPERTLFDV